MAEISFSEKHERRQAAVGVTAVSFHIRTTAEATLPGLTLGYPFVRFGEQLGTEDVRQFSHRYSAVDTPDVYLAVDVHTETAVVSSQSLEETVESFSANSSNLTAPSSTSRFFFILSPSLAHRSIGLHLPIYRPIRLARSNYAQSRNGCVSRREMRMLSRPSAVSAPRRLASLEEPNNFFVFLVLQTYSQYLQAVQVPVAQPGSARVQALRKIHKHEQMKAPQYIHKHEQIKAPQYIHKHKQINGS